MALTEQQRAARVASLATARAARAANRAGNPEPTLAAPENLATTVPAPEIDPAILARAAAQLAQRTAAEEAANLAERAKNAGIDPDKPTGLNAVASAQVAKEELMARAARQKALAGKDEQPTVKVRITKMGDGKVSMGIHVAGIGEAYFEKGEIVELPLDVATAVENRGFAEIQD